MADSTLGAGIDVDLVDGLNLSKNDRLVDGGCRLEVAGLDGPPNRFMPTPELTTLGPGRQEGIPLEIVFAGDPP